MVQQSMKNEEVNKCLKQTGKTQRILEYCRQHFINILPNTLSSKIGNKSQLNSLNQDICSVSIDYRYEQVKQVMKQLSLFLQLVIQNCVLTSNPKIRTESYRILGNFRNLLSRDLDDFETIINDRNKSRLPFYEVDCKDFINKDVFFKVPPQISLYQDVLLFYIYTKPAQEELFCNHPIMMTREERISILTNHVPFLNPLYIPLIDERLENKAKFSELQDRFLLMIAHQHLKDMAKAKAIFMPQRPQHQIRNRAKNMCSISKDIINPLKQFRTAQYYPLSEEQIQPLIKGYQRFGARWPVISKYYQLRTSNLLKEDYEKCPKLQKKRAKQNIIPQYACLKTLIDERLEQYQKKHQKICLDEQEAEIIIEQDDAQIVESINEQSEVRYKIINHLTFAVAEI